VGDSGPLTAGPWKRIQEGAQWDELIMPASMLGALRALPERLSERFWSGDGGREGLLVLFRGPAGTGKSLAARAVAAELRLPVFQADLARLAAGGATHSTQALGQVFTAAQRSGAVVELDGAEVLAGISFDAVQSDRVEQAGIDTGELLRRAEEYPGVVIVTCRHAHGAVERIADVADLVLDFAVPDAATRMELWHSYLPADAQVGEGEVALLADGFPVSAAAIAAACKAATRQAEIEGIPLVLAHLTAALKHPGAVDHSAPAARATPAPPPRYQPPPTEPRQVPPPPPRHEPIRPASPPPRVEPLRPRPVEPAAPPPRPVEPAAAPAARPARAPEPAPARPAEAPPATPRREPTPERVLSPAATAAPPVKRALPRALILAAVVGGFAAVGLGFALAHTKSSGPGAPVVLDRQVNNGKVRFSYPSAWSVQPALALPGLALSQPVIVGSSKKPSGTLEVGTLAGTTGGLPATFVTTLSGQPEPALVTLGAQRFYRLLDSGVSHGGGGEAAYVLSTGGRTVVAVCRAAGRPFASLCERVLATLVVTPVNVAPSPLSTAYATGLNTILGSLAASQKAWLAQLSAARTATRQASAASALAAVYSKAAKAVSGLPAGGAASINSSLAAALSRMSSVYVGLDRAAASGSSRAYTKAQGQIAGANGQVAAALAALKRFGYSVA